MEQQNTTTAWPPLVGLTVDEAAQALRVNPRAIRDAIRTGGLPARTVGKGYRIDVDALKAWLGKGEAVTGPDMEDEDRPIKGTGSEAILVSTIADVTKRGPWSDNNGPSAYALTRALCEKFGVDSIGEIRFGDRESAYQWVLAHAKDASINHSGRNSLPAD